MRQYPFKLVNVFAESHFGGNPLAVFYQAEGLTEPEMQQIAIQFNLSETVFIFPSRTRTASADLRIFTPAYELALAGHPTLGAAYVLQQQAQLASHFELNTQAKAVQLFGEAGRMEMAIQGYEIHACSASQAKLAQTVGLSSSQIAEQAYWLNSGSPHLLLEVLDERALSQTQIDLTLLVEICRDEPRSVIYLWHRKKDLIFSRLLYVDKGQIREDSGTGSACANLGAYFIAQGDYPCAYTIHQGDHLGRPNRLSLRVDDGQTIYVGGQVIEVGEGNFFI